MSLRPWLMLVISGLLWTACGGPPGQEEVAGAADSCAPVPGATPQPFEFTLEGRQFRLDEGRVEEQSGGTWQFYVQLYDPDYFQTHYRVVDCQVYRVDPDDPQIRIQVRRNLAEGFENAAELSDLIGLERGWTAFTLQSPLAPTVSEYVELRQCILADNCDFLDNRVEPTTAEAYAGSGSLRTYSVAPTTEMVTAKASLDTELLHAVAGDRVLVGAWFKVTAGQPFTLLDLESAWMEGFPGLRVVLGESGYLHVELKWLDKPTYRPTSTSPAFPLGEWVHVELEALLRPDAEGQVILRQNGVAIIDAPGRTLPLVDTVLNNLEVGISANNHSAGPTEVLVDEVRFKIE